MKQTNVHIFITDSMACWGANRAADEQCIQHQDKSTVYLYIFHITENKTGYHISSEDLIVIYNTGFYKYRFYVVILYCGDGEIIYK